MMAGIRILIEIEMVGVRYFIPGDEKNLFRNILFFGSGIVTLPEHYRFVTFPERCKSRIFRYRNDFLGLAETIRIRNDLIRKRNDLDPGADRRYHIIVT